MLVMEENPSPTAIQVLGHLTRANYCFNCDHIKQLELAKKRAGLPNDPVPEVLADDPVTVKAEPNSRPHEIELLGEYSHDSRGGEVLANKHQLLRLATAITELADSTERGRAAYYAGGRDTLIVKIPHEEGGEAAVYFSLVEENPKRDALAGCGYL
ncbi:MAG: hypothetical protein OXE53_13035 [Deltaproteobacteria bacterium]|nr:hypothetical protein [Deltaproteobacteria bacterium]